MKKILLKTGLIILLVASHAFAQNNMLVQELEPHPYVDMNAWLSHKGELSMDKVLKDKPSIWEPETLNVPNWEKNGIKWFKKEIVIPNEFNGLDVILHINVSPSAIVYVNGKELFRCHDYSGRGVLALSAKAGSKYSVEIKTKNGGYNSRFYYARLVGMPKGYGAFLSSFNIIAPKGGVYVKDWKFKLHGEDDDAYKIDF